MPSQWASRPDPYLSGQMTPHISKGSSRHIWYTPPPLPLITYACRYACTPPSPHHHVCVHLTLPSSSRMHAPHPPLIITYECTPPSPCHPVHSPSVHMEEGHAYMTMMVGGGMI